MKYKYLEKLDCFDKLKEKVPDLLDDLEEKVRWYEEDATDEDIGEGGENLPRFLVEIYGGSNDIDGWLEEIMV